MDLQYALNLFKVIDTAVEHECFFCPEIIDPSIHFEHLSITIPTKENTYLFHLNCFEQMQWSMLNFWVRLIKEEKTQVVH